MNNHNRTLSIYQANKQGGGGGEGGGDEDRKVLTKALRLFLSLIVHIL